MVAFSRALDEQLDRPSAYSVKMKLSKFFSAKQSIQLLLCVIDQEVIKIGQRKNKKIKFAPRLTLRTEARASCFWPHFTEGLSKTSSKK